MSIMNRRKEDIMELKDRIKYNVVKDFPNKEVIFVDFMPTFMDINLMDEISRAIYSLIDKSRIDYIVMPESRGYILGSFVANKYHANPLPIRKHGKLPKECIQDSYTYQTEYSQETLDLPNVDLKDKFCFFIDDVYALGGTYYACERLVEKAGGKMLGGACLYNVGLNDNPRIFTFLNNKDIKD